MSSVSVPHANEGSVEVRTAEWHAENFATTIDNTMFAWHTETNKLHQQIIVAPAWEHSATELIVHVAQATNHSDKEL